MKELLDSGIRELFTASLDLIDERAYNIELQEGLLGSKIFDPDDPTSPYKPYPRP